MTAWGSGPPSPRAQATTWPQVPRIAIIVPTADASRDMAAKAIARARATTSHLGARVVVVESSGPAFRFSRSINEGLRQAPDADAWILLNDDCFMDDGWLDHMVAAARAHPEVGLVGAVLRHPDGRIQHAGGYLLQPGRFLVQWGRGKRAPLWALRRILRSARKGHAYGGHYAGVRRGHRLDYLTGACVLLTAACRQVVGDYDEAYEFSFEDIDHSLRALEAGFELALAVEATGVHLERATGGGLVDKVRRSEAVFHARWPRRRVLAVTRARGRRGVHHGRGMCPCP